MPKIEISYETMDGMVLAGLKNMLNTMIDGWRAAHPADKEQYAKDIDAIEKVLKIYEG